MLLGGGRNDGLAIINPAAPTSNPTHWLTHQQMHDIKAIKTAPLDVELLTRIAEEALQPSHFFELFKAKHILSLINALGTAKSDLQSDWAEQYHVPDWWKEIVRPVKDTHPRNMTDTPQPDADISKWLTLYAKRNAKEFTL
jgi:hypothetical protein